MLKIVMLLKIVVERWIFFFLVNFEKITNLFLPHLRQKKSVNSPILTINSLFLLEPIVSSENSTDTHQQSLRDENN